MKIVDQTRKTTRFCELKGGDAFYCEEYDDFFIKMSCSVGCDDCDGEANAVTLSGGIPYGFEPDQAVMPCHEELILK